MNNIFMAIYEEHKQRTNHDIFNLVGFSKIHINCNVCMYLNKEKRNYEKLEREYYEKEVSHDE